MLLGYTVTKACCQPKKFDQTISPHERVGPGDKTMARVYELSVHSTDSLAPWSLVHAVTHAVTRSSSHTLFHLSTLSFVAILGEECGSGGCGCGG